MGAYRLVYVVGVRFEGSIRFSIHRGAEISLT